MFENPKLNIHIAIYACNKTTNMHNEILDEIDEIHFFINLTSNILLNDIMLTVLGQTTYAFPA